MGAIVLAVALPSRCVGRAAVSTIAIDSDRPARPRRESRQPTACSSSTSTVSRGASVGRQSRHHDEFWKLQLPIGDGCGRMWQGVPDRESDESIITWMMGRWPIGDGSIASDCAQKLWWPCALAPSPLRRTLPRTQRAMGLRRCH